VSALVAIAAVAAALLVLLRRESGRLELLRRAEHELRGAAAALELVCDSWCRERALEGPAEALRVQLDRLGAGLADLARVRARARRWAPRTLDLGRFVDAAIAPWQGRPGAHPADRAGTPVPVVADRGRLAQVVGNLVANAAEHGRGTLDVRTTPLRGGGVRLELRNPRDPGAGTVAAGRGLGIARRAARELGGRLDVQEKDGEVVAALELPSGARPSRAA
jgi:signal transduction histidine kinase